MDMVKTVINFVVGTIILIILGITATLVLHEFGQEILIPSIWELIGAGVPISVLIVIIVWKKFR